MTNICESIIELYTKNQFEELLEVSSKLENLPLEEKKIAYKFASDYLDSLVVNTEWITKELNKISNGGPEIYSVMELAKERYEIHESQTPIHFFIFWRIQPSLSTADESSYLQKRENLKDELRGLSKKTIEQLDRDNE